MLVYRVENENGNGPYMAFAPVLAEMSAAHGDAEHPTPDEEGMRCIFADEYCAVQSLEGAQAWFEGYGEVLDEAGFELTVWDAQDVRCGKKQVVFRKDTARMVASYPIMEYIR